MLSRWFGPAVVVSAATLVLVLPVPGSWAAGGDELWAVSLTAPGAPEVGDSAAFYATAVGPDGVVYSVGTAAQRSDVQAMVTVAHSSNGEQLWVARIAGPTGEAAGGRALAVDAGRDRVYVTGFIDNTAGDAEFLTVAYDLDDGTEVWRARYKDRGLGAVGQEIAVDPIGGTVYVGGRTTTASQGFDWGTLAYASTGSRLWFRSFNASGAGNDYLEGLGLDAQANVYLTGYTANPGANDQFSTTLSYAPDGRIRWRHTSPAGPSESNDLTNDDLVVDDVRGVVYTTGRAGRYATYQRLVQAYSTTGQRLWRTTLADGGYGEGAMAVNEASGRLYVLMDDASTSEFQFRTTAVEPDGTVAWSQRLASSGRLAQAVAVDPTTDTVYVTGQGYTESTRTVTAAYSTVGVLLWRADAWAGLSSFPAAIATDPGTGHVYVVGGAGDDDDPYAYSNHATVLAYAGR